MLTRQNYLHSRLCTNLRSCIPARGQFKSVQARREQMWSNYHQVRCSSVYISAWKIFLCQNLGTPGHAIFLQCVGDRIFKSLIKKSFPVIQQEAEVDNTITPTISHQEMNALRYAAGYVPRALRKKLKKSANPLKGQLFLCLTDLLDDGDERHTHSEEWLDLVDRGGQEGYSRKWGCYILLVSTVMRLGGG